MDFFFFYGIRIQVLYTSYMFNKAKIRSFSWEWIPFIKVLELMLPLWYHIWKPVKRHIRDSTHKHKCTRALTKEEESFTGLIRIKVTCIPKKAKFVYSYKKSNKVFFQMLWKGPNDHRHGWSWRYWPPAHITWLASHAHGVLQKSLEGKENI